MTRLLLPLAVLAGLALAGCSDEPETPPAAPVSSNEPAAASTAVDPSDQTRDAAVAEMEELQATLAVSRAEYRAKRNEVLAAKEAGDTARENALRAELEPARGRFVRDRDAYRAARDKVEAMTAGAE